MKVHISAAIDALWHSHMCVAIRRNRTQSYLVSIEGDVVGWLLTSLGTARKIATVAAQCTVQYYKALGLLRSNVQPLPELRDLSAGAGVLSMIHVTALFRGRPRCYLVLYPPGSPW